KNGRKAKRVLHMIQMRSIASRQGQLCWVLAGANGNANIVWTILGEKGFHGLEQSFLFWVFVCFFFFFLHCTLFCPFLE
ncbi:hypothetical protein BDP55DRAFT_643580, partial [Colletotrichum godetiae]